MTQYILSIDQGTTSSRAILFDAAGNIVSVAQQEFRQFFPEDGWVEHDPDEIWSTTLESCRTAIRDSGVQAGQISCIGITNQRETTVVWDRISGKPVYNAIVWQDRRTAEFCDQLRKQGYADTISEKTGLVVDPYFSASKICWILDHVEGARQLANEGRLAFGTIDTFLLWRLTGGSKHATDATNASRTSIFDIHRQQWDDELLRIFNVPASLLPEVKDSSDDYGCTKVDLLGAEIPIYSLIGDQQSALVGQACFTPGMVKSTYGTGCFMIVNTGEKVIRSQNRLLSTVAYRLNGKTCYALEGSIFVAGAAIQWIRDGLGLIHDAGETEALADRVGVDNPVYLVPAFTGLGAPHWDPNARGAIFGLTRDTGIAEVVTAGLQSVCYQTRDLLAAIARDGIEARTIRVDGGMVVNNWVIQFLSDILGVTVDRPRIVETTALGAAYMAGLKAGVYKNTDELESLWQLDARFEPAIEPAVRDRLYQGWLDVVEKVKSSD